MTETRTATISPADTAVERLLTRAEWHAKLSHKVVVRAARAAAMALLDLDPKPGEDILFTSILSLGDMPEPLADMSEGERNRYDTAILKFRSTVTTECESRKGRHLEHRGHGVYRLLSTEASAPAVEREGRDKTDRALTGQLQASRRILPHLANAEDRQRCVDGIASASSFRQAVRRPSKAIDPSDPSLASSPLSFKHRS